MSCSCCSSHDFSLALQQRKRGEGAGWPLVLCVGQTAKLCSVALCCGFDYNKITGDEHGSRPMIMSRWMIYHHHYLGFCFANSKSNDQFNSLGYEGKQARKRGRSNDVTRCVCVAVRICIT